VSWITDIFSGGAFKSIENIATEWIQTDKENAEAQALLVKAMDPNGLLRRNISDRVMGLYTLYVLFTLVLLVCESFGIGPIIDGKMAVSVATEKVTGLFTPITTAFGAIVSASFGVNYANARSGK